MNSQLEFSALMPCDSEFLYRWHTMPRAINRLTPPWERVQILKPPSSIKANEMVHMKINNFIDWKLKILEVEIGSFFSDTQVYGPFAYWTHTHSMQKINESSSLLVERINYKLPLFDSVLNNMITRFKIKPLFDYRFKTMINDIKFHYKHRNKKYLKILVTGSSGMVGSDLFDLLSSAGHEVFKLVRNKPKSSNEIYWDTENNKISSNDLEGFDAVIHLAGENIANKRWSKEQKKKIASSRIDGTNLIVEALLNLKSLPQVFISASAIGFYGDREEEICDEESLVGTGFLADTCLEWEAVTKKLEKRSVRVINTRFGIILDPRAGALSKILPLFLLGGGGNIGNGKQWMSWIALDDVLRAILHCVYNENISGPVNFVAPSPVRNKDFTKILAKVINRPALLPAPAFALRLALGEMADELLLSSTKVDSRVLNESGFEFAFPDLESYLRHILH